LSIKILGIAAGMAATAALLFGPASASADRLCTTEPSAADGACTGSTYPKNTNLSASLAGGNLKFATSSGTVECTKSTIVAKVTVSAGGGSGVNVVGEVTTWLFGNASEEQNNCSLGGELCTVSDGLNVPYENIIQHAAGTKGNGYFVLKGTAPFSEPATIVKCGTEIDCIFNAGELISFELTGGAPATFEREKLLETEGNICPEEVRLKANYQLLPKPMFITGQ
jgi:hypothetical protein